MPSLHPLTHVQQQIKSPNIRAAFDKAIGDKRSPNEFSLGELDKFFAAATHNDSSVRGHDLTKEELADLQMIRREGGAYLLRQAAERKAYDGRLATYESKPMVSIMDTDPKVGVKSVALNKVAISGRAEGNLCPAGVMCVIGGPTTVTMEVDGQKFAVQPHGGERASSIAKRLAAELEEGGYKTTLRTQAGRTILSVLSKRDLFLKSLTTDRDVRMGITGSTLTISMGIGAGIHFAGGKIGVSINGQDFTVNTRRDMDVDAGLNALKKKIEAGGYDVEVNGLPTIDTLEQAWSIKPAQRKTYEPGTYASLTGTLLEGNADDSSKMFKLDKKIQVGDKMTDTIKVPSAAHFPAGKTELSGRLDVVQLPMEIFPPMFEVQLSGVSNVGRGEPKYDGQNFTNNLGKACEKLLYTPEGLFDAPARLFVLDQSNDRAFVGSYGNGNANPALNMNEFHGFSGSRSIKNPTAADEAAVEFKLPNDTPGGGGGRAREQWPYSKETGKALVQVSDEIGVVGQRWFMDPDTTAIYGFNVAGPRDRAMTHVIKKDPRDV